MPPARSNSRSIAEHETQVLSALNDDPADVPQIVHLETLQALRGLVRGGKVSLAEAPGAFRRLTLLPWRSHDHMPLRSRVWALRDRCSAYDAAYVALAERLEMALVTADRRLAHAARGLVPVVLVTP
jgi:predicted nucleic acid-binding protein